MQPLCQEERVLTPEDQAESHRFALAKAQLHADLTMLAQLSEPLRRTRPVSLDFATVAAWRLTTAASAWPLT